MRKRDYYLPQMIIALSYLTFCLHHTSQIFRRQKTCELLGEESKWQCLVVCVKGKNRNLFLFSIAQKQIWKRNEIFVHYRFGDRGVASQNLKVSNECTLLLWELIPHDCPFSKISFTVHVCSTFRFDSKHTLLLRKSSLLQECLWSMLFHENQVTSSMKTVSKSSKSSATRRSAVLSLLLDFSLTLTPHF